MVTLIIRKQRTDLLLIILDFNPQCCKVSLMNHNQVGIVMFVTGNVMSGPGLMSPGAPDVAGDHDDGLTSSPREHRGSSDCSSSRLSS